MYLASPGRPTDVGLQLGKACCPRSRYGKRGNVFISSVSSISLIFLFLPCPSLSFPLLSPIGVYVYEHISIYVRTCMVILNKKE